MCLYIYMTVSLAIFSSGIASCRAQIFSISLTIDVARCFCLPLQIFSHPRPPWEAESMNHIKGPLNSWLGLSNGEPQWNI